MTCLAPPILTDMQTPRAAASISGDLREGFGWHNGASCKRLRSSVGSTLQGRLFHTGYRSRVHLPRLSTFRHCLSRITIFFPRLYLLFIEVCHLLRHRPLIDRPRWELYKSSFSGSHRRATCRPYIQRPRRRTRPDHGYRNKYRLGLQRGVIATLLARSRRCRKVKISRSIGHRIRRASGGPSKGSRYASHDDDCHWRYHRARSPGRLRAGAC